ncbi:hypothetical protein FGF1_04530 [Flavobacteriaceae bacterium GF1]
MAVPKNAPIETGMFKSIEYFERTYTADENRDTITMSHLIILNQYVIGILFSSIIA